MKLITSKIGKPYVGRFYTHGHAALQKQTWYLFDKIPIWCKTYMVEVF